VTYVDDESVIFDETDALIEPVSYDENQELLRAFGGQAPQATGSTANQGQQVSASTLAA
jgi:hypothetical protein